MQLSRLSERLEIRIVAIILRLAALEDGPIADWLGLDVLFGRVHVEWRPEVKTIFFIKNVA
jgi:hypothetical protein